jgi:hypothetical protein
MINNNYLMRRIACIVLYGSLICLPGCRISSEKYSDVSVLISRDFNVARYSSGGKREDIYVLDGSSKDLITCAAYGTFDNTTAIALKNKYGIPSSARIILLEDRPPHRIARSLEVGVDDVRDVSISSNGKIALIAAKNKLDEPHEIIEIDKISNNKRILASGKYFMGLSWDISGDRIYFASMNAGVRSIEYVELSSPGLINKIAQGVSVSASDKTGDIAYIGLDGSLNIVARKAGGYITKSHKDNLFDIKYDDEIKYVKGSDRIVVQEYVKGKISKLKIVAPPYHRLEEFLDGISMVKFDATSRQ